MNNSKWEEVVIEYPSSTVLVKDSYTRLDYGILYREYCAHYPYKVRASWGWAFYQDEKEARRAKKELAKQ